MENIDDKLKKEIENEITSYPAVDIEKNRKIFRRALLFFAVILLIAGSFLAGNRYGQNKSDDIEKSVSVSDALVENKLLETDNTLDFSLFWKVWNLIKDKHIDREKLDAQEMIYGAINGMLKATGDPYTDFFDPKQTKAFSQDIEGSFEGIGAELGIKDNLLTIIAPLDGSPAQKAGLRSGDKILKVDDKIVADFTIDEAVSLIRGKKGTQIKLTILHEGDETTRDITVTRDNIEIKNLKLEFKEQEIAYIKLTKFSDNVDREFDDAVNQIVSHGSQGIILDLRDNPGGLLDKSVAIASRMIPKDEIVVIEEDNTGRKENLYTSGGDKLSSVPTVVLINEGSASASEILAGALRDNQEITLIGKKSFGKGSVQQLIDLPENSSVKITIAKWLTPRGDYIMEKGISPDIEVDLTLDDYNNKRDPQLDKALEIIKEKINL